MYGKARSHSPVFGMSWSPANVALTILLTFMFLIFLFSFLTLTGQSALGQTYSVIYTYTNGADGSAPIDIAMDRFEALYVTTASGPGPTGGGGVAKLSNLGSGWTLVPLYTFLGGSDGAHPVSGVTIASNGILYGTTDYGGYNSSGTVYSLRPRPRPQANVCANKFCNWDKTQLHRFMGGSDGRYPAGLLVLDQQGNLYGTTWSGGDYDRGTIYELSGSGSKWTESILYRFTGANDGAAPAEGVVFDRAGNMYGTTFGGGAYNSGTVFKLSPASHGWTFTLIYTFTGGGDGSGPSGLVVDCSGNLYGATYEGGAGGGGTIYELSPSNNGWTFTLLHSLQGRAGTVGSLTFDRAGNLYGTARIDGAYGWGSVYKLTPSSGGWTFTTLYDFTGGSDGGQPQGSIVIDHNGDLYGVSPWGGENQGYSGYGAVWQIKP